MKQYTEIFLFFPLQSPFPLSFALLNSIDIRKNQCKRHEHPQNARHLFLSRCTPPSRGAQPRHKNKRICFPSRFLQKRNRGGRQSRFAASENHEKEVGHLEWEDSTLLEWKQDDYRIWVGDIGNDVTDELLMKTFSKYGSLLRARVVRDKRSGKSKGYAFVSFEDPLSFAKALREVNGKYIGNRPCKLRKSKWLDRGDLEALNNPPPPSKHR